ncbi:polysaccharide pyruvyl transferase family protein [Halomonas sp. SpR8]|uniref:polysaccharide pyruvyl transferase family protein n=1 Tax=Halomonas sp. SpR8 TaxID=3050463 RepID=UPI0027E4B102|nr:polysaccharide pyruvyl transferase family protein [Halomonas sp. SpR8]MDQ7727287.1 polysaccharide pyruvyl transferase family protein [Halomonas sp. SpR8]
MESLDRITGKKPVVGLAGFFGYGNYGDELFVTVYKQWLSPYFDLVFLSDVLDKPYYSRPIEEIVDSVDAIIIGGGDIVQPWGMDDRYFNKLFLKKPVFIIGVGVPIRSASSRNPNHIEKEWIIDKYRNFFSHPSVKMIHARDDQSSNWIRRKLNPKVAVTEAPDIVCSMDLPSAIDSVSEVKTLGVVTRSRPNQEDDYSEILKVADKCLSMGWNVRHIILGTGRVGKKDYENADKLRIKKELVYSESLSELTEAIGGCSALLSMKFHGTVVATMYGIPSIVMVPTNKNRNFMNRIGRSDLLSKFDSPDLLQKFGDAPETISSDSVEMLRDRAGQIMELLVFRLMKSLNFEFVQR